MISVPRYVESSLGMICDSPPKKTVVPRGEEVLDGRISSSGRGENVGPDGILLTPRSPVPSAR